MMIGKLNVHCEQREYRVSIARIFEQKYLVPKCPRPTYHRCEMRLSETKSCQLLSTQDPKISAMKLNFRPWTLRATASVWTAGPAFGMMGQILGSIKITGHTTLHCADLWFGR